MSAKDKNNQNQDPVKNQVETTGHSWDGIEELNNPLPRWWLYFFYGCIAFALLWSVLYPSWPLIHGATQGVLGYDSRKAVDDELAAQLEANKALDAQLIAASYEEIAADTALNSYAQNGGAAIFRTYCIQCHGAGAAGSPGYPNLNDNDWLWGGKYEDIAFSITHGIRDEADPDTRFSEMPPFGESFSNEEIDTLIYYVQSLSGEADEAFDAELASTLFADNCASCHGEEAKGDTTQGSANLTDAIWLYGGDYATIRETIRNGRGNVMPHWGERFNESQIKQIVTYVHSRGGGE